MLLLSPKIFRFLVIGTSAFLVNWLVVFALVEMFRLNPLTSNVIGFLLAFNVSYFGHKNWTFEAQANAHAESLIKFFTVAIIGFLVNESVYAFLLHVFSLHYMIGLPIALVVAAVSTYILSNFWAFKTSKVVK